MKLLLLLFTVAFFSLGIIVPAYALDTFDSTINGWTFTGSGNSPITHSTENGGSILLTKNISNGNELSGFKKSFPTGIIPGNLEFDYKVKLDGTSNQNPIIQIKINGDSNRKIPTTLSSTDTGWLHYSEDISLILPEGTEPVLFEIRIKFPGADSDATISFWMDNFISPYEVPPDTTSSIPDNTITDVTGYTFVGVTSNGVTFPIKFSIGNNDGTGNGDGTGDGTGDGQSMIDGMGLQSRIIQQEYIAKLIYGSGVTGEAKSLVPYLTVNSDTDFVGLVEDTDRVLTYHIPEFYKSYRFGNTFDTDNVETVTEDVSWTNIVNAVSDGNTLRSTKSVEVRMPSGASSLQTIGPDGGHVSYTFGDGIFYTSIGLSNGVEDYLNSSFDFRFYHGGSGGATCREDGQRCYISEVAPGDIMKISVESDVVKFWKNDILLYTSANSPTYPLSVHTSLNSNNVLEDVQIKYTNYFTVTTPDRLDDTTGNIPNILGYSQSRTTVGSVITSISDDINISGNGEVILKLHDYSDQSLILRGDTGANGIAKVITSPINLMDAPYTNGKGYLSHSGGNPGTNGISIVAGLQSTHTGEYDYSVYHPYQFIRYNCRGGCIPHGYSISAHYTQHSGISNLVKVNNGDHTLITGHTSTSSVSAFRLYDTLPSIQGIKLSDGTFETKYLFPDEQSYLYVKPNGGTVTIKAETSVDIPYVKITNLPANIPYQIIKDGLPIITGMTSPAGKIIINNLENAPSITSGILNLYPDSLSYRGSFSTVVLDKLNHQTIHIESTDDKVYTVHAYVNVPVTGNVIITNTHLNGDNTLSLSYLDGNYDNGDAISVPVIPGYSSVSMEINGVKTSLQFSNVLGGNQIKIAESETSTINKNSLNTRISSAEAIVGTTQYVIATSDGTVNAIVTETISGSISITNKYVLEKIPSPPPPPVRRDPLSGWVDIYKNGDFVKQVLLGTNPYPDFTPGNSILNNVVTQSVVYAYPDYLVSGTLSVDVNAGDFVEFYLYGKIHGDIDRYTAPSGFILLSESGYSTATVSIRSASIQTG